MTARSEAYDESLAKAHEHVRRWLSSLDERPIGPRVTATELLESLGGPLPEHGTDPVDVVDELAAKADPGLMAIGSGRFFGWVMGGTLPAGLAADWMVSGWDQNAGMRYSTPATAALEESAGRWLLELLHLPSTADVGFVTGATMSNFTCLAAARQRCWQRPGGTLSATG